MFKSNWSRRSFLEVAGSTAAASFVSWLPTSAATTSQMPVRFAYVGSQGETQGIHVFAVSAGKWSPVQFVESAAPSSFAMSSDKRTVFVANATHSFENLPKASVESYRIAADGKLTLLSRQGLSLSGVAPQHIALSPDGRTLAVSVTGGGAYNLLPVAEDGALDSIAAIRKEVGAGPVAEEQATARPQMVTFDAKGRLVASDLGADRISVFEADGSSLAVAHRTETAPGSGPSAIALHASGSILFVGNALDGTVTAHGYDAAQGRLLDSSSIVKAMDSSSAAARLTALEAHPEGNLVFTAWKDEASGGIASWKVDRLLGTLSHVSTGSAAGSYSRLAVAGDMLIALEASQGAVVALPLSLGTSTKLADVPAPSAVQLL